MGLVKRCDWCAGRGFVPNSEMAVEACGICAGGGWSPVCGTLAPTKTYPDGRPFRYFPGTGELIVTRKKKSEAYRLSEFKPEFGSRAFVCRKASTNEEHHLLVIDGSVRCDCPAASWGASERANRIAHENHEPTHATAGCVHSDFVKLALEQKLFDLPDEQAEAALEWWEQFEATVA